MSNNPRCLYDNRFSGFLCDSKMSVLGELNAHYHGDIRTTARDAWEAEITIMRETLLRCRDKNGRIIFEYDIPRLGKRIHKPQSAKEPENLCLICGSQSTPR